MADIPPLTRSLAHSHTSIADPLNQIWIRSAQSEFNAALKSGDSRTAKRLAAKIMNLTGINLLNKMENTNAKTQTP